MATTTIKVTSELRDRVTARARSEGKSTAAFLAVLMDEWEHSRRERELQDAIAAHPPDPQYWSEFAAFAALDAKLPDA